MRKSDGTKTAKVMRDTWYFNAQEERIPQSMITADENAKGIWAVLIERGLVHERERLNFICRDCEMKFPTIMNDAAVSSS